MEDQEKINKIAEKLKNNPELAYKFSMALFQFNVGNDERKQEAFEAIALIMTELDLMP